MFGGSVFTNLGSYFFGSHENTPSLINDNNVLLKNWVKSLNSRIFGNMLNNHNSFHRLKSGFSEKYLIFEKNSKTMDNKETNDKLIQLSLEFYKDILNYANTSYCAKSWLISLDGLEWSNDFNIAYNNALFGKLDLEEEIPKMYELELKEYSNKSCSKENVVGHWRTKSNTKIAAANEIISKMGLYEDYSKDYLSSRNSIMRNGTAINYRDLAIIIDFYITMRPSSGVNLLEDRYREDAMFGVCNCTIRELENEKEIVHVLIDNSREEHEIPMNIHRTACNHCGSKDKTHIPMYCPGPIHLQTLLTINYKCTRCGSTDPTHMQLFCYANNGKCIKCGSDDPGHQFDDCDSFKH